MLVVNIENYGDASVFRCVGRLVAGEEVGGLKRAVLCHQDSKTVVLDFSQVSTLDGAGMGLVAFLAGWTRVMGVTLKIMSPTVHVRRLLQMTHLDSVLEITDGEWAPEIMPHAIAARANEVVAHR